MQQERAITASPETNAPDSDAPVPNWNPVTASGDFTEQELQDETFLTENIGHLWEWRQGYSIDAERNRKSIRGIDATLGQMFFNLKLILAKPGRNGGWSSWLAEHNISRSTADRLVRRFAKAHGINDKLSHDPISEPTEVEVSKLSATVWRRVEGTLTTPRSRYDFLRCLMLRFGLTGTAQEHGVLLLDPDYVNEEESLTLYASTTGTGDVGDVL